MSQQTIKSFSQAAQVLDAAGLRPVATTPGRWRVGNEELSRGGVVQRARAVEAAPAQVVAIEGDASFDYTQLDPETRIVVQQKASEIRERIDSIKRATSEIGQRLIETKARLGHGQWGAWLRAEFQWSQDSAERFIQVAQLTQQNPHYAEFEDRFARTALTALSAPSTPEAARNEALAQAEAGKQVSHKEVKQIIARHKPPLAELTAAQRRARAVGYELSSNDDGYLLLATGIRRPFATWPEALAALDELIAATPAIDIDQLTSRLVSYGYSVATDVTGNTTHPLQLHAGPGERPLRYTLVEAQRLVERWDALPALPDDLAAAGVRWRYRTDSRVQVQVGAVPGTALDSVDEALSQARHLVALYDVVAPPAATADPTPGDPRIAAMRQRWEALGYEQFYPSDAGYTAHHPKLGKGNYKTWAAVEDSIARKEAAAAMEAERRAAIAPLPTPDDRLEREAQGHIARHEWNEARKAAYSMEDRARRNALLAAITQAAPAAPVPAAVLPPAPSLERDLAALEARITAGTADPRVDGEILERLASEIEAQVETLSDDDYEALVQRINAADRALKQIQPAGAYAPTQLGQILRLCDRVHWAAEQGQREIARTAYEQLGQVLGAEVEVGHADVSHTL